MAAVSSPAVGDGKTTTAINLAAMLTRVPGAHVLLVDLDLRRPALSQYLGFKRARAESLVDVAHEPNLALDDTDREYGLIDAVQEPDLTLDDIVRPYPQFNLSVLLAGPPCLTVFEVLRSQRLGELLEEARQRYDYILLDSPPLIPFPDCRFIERWVDGFLVVVNAHTTPQALIEEAFNAVDPARIVGCVFNGDTRSESQYSASHPYGPTLTGKATGRWNRALKKIRGCFRFRPR